MINIRFKRLPKQTNLSRKNVYLKKDKCKMPLIVWFLTLKNISNVSFRFLFLMISFFPKFSEFLVFNNTLSKMIIIIIINSATI